MIELVFGRFPPVERRGLVAILGFGAVMLAIRLLLAQPFWASGQTRWISFPTKIATSTTYLFENVFVLHFGLFDMPIPFPLLTAHVTAMAEIVLPVLIVLGLLTRLGALALFAMTVVIQLVFPDAFFNATDPMNSHALWMAYAVVLVVCGPGVFSLDFLLRRIGLRRASVPSA
ncbi:MAG: DoxX family protein [Alphaproteobacteria bacterium]|nr:DoxX family protein [Alphaproteobacteria bacterium]